MLTSVGKITLCLGLWLVAVSSWAQVGFHQLETLTVQNGLPQGFVGSIVQGQRGFIWLATRDGLCRYDGVRYTIYRHDAHNPNSLTFGSISEIAQAPDGNLWVRSEHNDLDLFNPITEQVRCLTATPLFRRLAGHPYIRSIAVDGRATLWVGTVGQGLMAIPANWQNGRVYRRNPADSTSRISSDTVNVVLAGRRTIWVGTPNGLTGINPVTGQTRQYQPDSGVGTDKSILTLRERPNGQLFIGYRGRFVVFDLAKHTSHTYALVTPDVPRFAVDPLGHEYVNLNRFADDVGLIPIVPAASLDKVKLVSLYADYSGVLWAGTNGSGVRRYNMHPQPFHSFAYQTNFSVDWLTRLAGFPPGTLPEPVRQAMPYELQYAYDKQQLWISGTGVPVYKSLGPTLTAVAPAGIPASLLPAGRAFSLSPLVVSQTGEVWGIMQPNNRTLVRYNVQKGTFTPFTLPLPVGHPYQFQAMVADGGRIWLATAAHGLLRVDLAMHRVVRWYSDPQNVASLPTNALLSLAQDPVQYQYLWIGSFGNGLTRLDKLTGQLRSFSTHEGLPNDMIYAILPDRTGDLWLSTNKGITRFDSRTFESSYYTVEDGLPGDEFNRNQSVQLPDRRLIFGGIDGYTVFNPNTVRDDNYEPSVTLTAIRINNQVVRPGEPNSPIRQDINATTDLILPHDQNFLSFDFSALQYNHSSKNRYRHRLEGLDREWVYSGNQATATYTNLSPGTYTFVVNAANTSGIWSPRVRKLRVNIRSPFWATWWAYGLYVFFTAGLIYGVVWLRLRRAKHQQEELMKSREAIQLKAVDELKSRFFANITHEFRTPLTLVLAPLEQLIKHIEDPLSNSRLRTVYRNANQLLRLTNELLDLSKLEAGSMTVTLKAGDLPEFLGQQLEHFTSVVDRKDVQLRFRTEMTDRYYWFDAEKIEKIINNLVANAIKFTDPGGVVDILLDKLPASAESEPLLPQTDLLQLTVRDTGIGIQNQKLPFIFNRFYQVDQNSGRFTEGSGIGLALVKELSDLLLGQLTVESKEGVGTTFRLSFSCLRATAVREEPDITPTSLPELANGPAASLNAPISDEAWQILLVEDNDELADFIMSTLSATWLVHRAANGREGLEMALASSPDLIISDVLMPEMDGFELTRRIKKDPRTNHIPVILLTARASTDFRTEGLTAGADDYLTKPFQVSELLLRVRNRLDQQQRSRRHHQTQLLREGHLPVAPALEDEFLSRVYAVIESRLADSTFGVEPLAEALNMSRMNLHRKLKAMANMSAHELIKAVRLKRASELLQGNLTVSEVTYQVGFESPAYLAKLFKEKYGMTPTDYMEQARLKPV